MNSIEKIIINELEYLGEEIKEREEEKNYCLERLERTQLQIEETDKKIKEIIQFISDKDINICN